ncbi:MAG TPA: hypothetical protein DEB63_06770 [Agrobacterium sp.]|nr:hypothetical protein [Agrobacterium sp.]
MPHQDRLATAGDTAVTKSNNQSRSLVMSDTVPIPYFKQRVMGRRERHALETLIDNIGNGKIADIISNGRS